MRSVQPCSKRLKLCEGFLPPRYEVADARIVKRLALSLGLICAPSEISRYLILALARARLRSSLS